MALIEPYSTAATVGKAAEQIAEFAVPGGAVAKATQGAGLLTRTGAQAATAGVVATAQTGDPKQASVPAVVAGATPVAGVFVRKAAEQTRYPTVSRAIAPGGILDDFFTEIGLKSLKQVVAGQVAEKLDEALRQVREVGIRGNRSDWDKIAKWLVKRRANFSETRAGLREAGADTASMREAARQLRAEEDLARIRERADLGRVAMILNAWAVVAMRGGGAHRLTRLRERWSRGERRRREDGSATLATGRVHRR